MYLIMFLCSILCFSTCVFSVLCFLVQMSPTKHAAPKRSSSKHARTDSDNFRSAEVDMKYNECYKDKTIPLTHYGPNCTNKAQTPEWSYCCTKGLSYWCTHSDQEHSSHQRL